jgi:hypothetical protein
MPALPRSKPEAASTISPHGGDRGAPPEHDPRRDAIAVLEQSRVVAHGTRDELLDRQGLSYPLQASQVA